MASQHPTVPTRPLAIAPGPPGGRDTGDGNKNATSAPPVMTYACQTCTKRKVKCDKTTPACSSCRKSRLECVYEAPRPRIRKRKLSDEVFERLARYERILNDNGLLDSDAAPPTAAADGTSQEPISLLWDEPEGSKAGKILAAEGKSRYLYLNSRLWQDLEEHQTQDVSDEELLDDGVSAHDRLGLPSDPLTGVFIGSPRLDLVQYHPAPKGALVLWETHIERVEPLCKILHIPSVGVMVERNSTEPENASKTDECLLFAIYHFSLYSMTEDDALSKFGQPRALLLQRYHFAARQALVNASFLKTAELPVLQALVLFLLASRSHFDSHTYWALIGVAVRIAQRIGVHRDGQQFGLPPFEVEMRRRLFYQLMPLDARASQMAGMGVSVFPKTWDTRPPLNVNDDQIEPDMTDTPAEQQGPTDMILCLSRICLGNFFIESTKSKKGGSPGSGQFDDPAEAEKAVNRAESEVEEKYIRYCDVVNPLHFLTICMARSGITAMRLRIRLSKAISPNATDAEVREVFQLAVKILDTDTAVCSHAGLNRFRWHTESFFLWGTWDSFVFLLSNVLLKRRPTFSDGEVNAVWERIEAMYRYHNELPHPKPALFVAIGRLTLQAWEADPSSRGRSGAGDPEFITALRSFRDRGFTKHGKDTDESERAFLQDKTPAGSPPQAQLAPGSVTDASLDNMPGGMAIDGGLDVGTADWAFWDQLIKDHSTLRDWE